MKGLAACLLVAACQQTSATPAPPPPPVDHTSVAAKTLAAGFAPEYVGVLAPQLVTAGDYAMTLDMTSSLFVTMELHLTANRHGALMVTLAADGSAHGCIASRGTDGADGQYHYEKDPAKRQGYRGTSDARVAALRGRWKIADGVAELSFDQVAWGTCDPAKAVTVTQPIVDLRCIATAKTVTLPADSLVCQSGHGGDLLGLGMPFGPPTNERPMGPPSGTQLVMAPDGLAVTYGLDDHPGGRTIKITPGAVAIEPAQFRSSR